MVKILNFRLWNKVNKLFAPQTSLNEPLELLPNIVTSVSIPGLFCEKGITANISGAGSSNLSAMARPGQSFFIQSFIICGASLVSGGSIQLTASSDDGGTGAIFRYDPVVLSQQQVIAVTLPAPFKLSENTYAVFDTTGAGAGSSYSISVYGYWA